MLVYSKILQNSATQINKTLRIYSFLFLICCFTATICEFAIAIANSQILAVKQQIKNNKVVNSSSFSSLYCWILHILAVNQHIRKLKVQKPSAWHKLLPAICSTLKVFVVFILGFAGLLQEFAEFGNNNLNKLKNLQFFLFIFDLLFYSTICECAIANSQMLAIKQQIKNTKTVNY